MNEMKITDDKLELDALYKKFFKAIKEKNMLNEELESINSKVDDILAQREAITDILLLSDTSNSIKEFEPKVNEDYDSFESDSDETKADYEVFSKNFGVIKFGKLPLPEQQNFYKENLIYPIGYECMRVYKKHKIYRKKTEFKNVFYRCEILRNNNLLEFRISTDDGMNLCGGHEIWYKFIRIFDSIEEFSCIEDFFGLTSIEIRKRLETLGDVKKLIGYNPLIQKNE